MNEAVNAPQIPPHVQLQQMVMAGWMSKAISVAAKLGLPDMVAMQPQTVGELAVQTRTHVESLNRVLRALASVGIFEQDESGRYALGAVGQTLRSDVPGSIRGVSILLGDDSHWRAWGELEYSVRTGLPAFDHTFGSDFFTYCAGQPETLKTFQDGMTSLSESIHAAIVQCYDFSGIDTIMDVGGGYGTLLATILKANPHMKGVLFDLPHVVEGAPEVLERWGVADRCEIVGGDFFAHGTLPQGVDACIMSTVIHDWDDERAQKILRNCHDATREGGNVLLGEMVVPDGPEPSPAKFCDLNMLVMTPGGRERTQAEYGALLQSCGYELSRVVPTFSPVSVVEGFRQ
ncbi:MAG TPA: methyltransferase [Abditibacteriaceae bacterium]|jgi:hypothetical protein